MEKNFSLLNLVHFMNCDMSLNLHYEWPHEAVSVEGDVLGLLWVAHIFSYIFPHITYHNMYIFFQIYMNKEPAYWS